MIGNMYERIQQRNNYKRERSVYKLGLNNNTNEPYKEITPEMNTEDASFSQKEFFENHKAGREHLPLREKRCSECPSTDMYYEISKSLSEQETELQVDCASSWFCHCTPNKSCRGVADYLSVKGSIDIENNKVVPKE